MPAPRTVRIPVHSSTTTSFQNCRMPLATRRPNSPASSADRRDAGIRPLPKRTVATWWTAASWGVASIMANCSANVCPAGPKDGFGVSRSGM
ncbi:hypothetical protein AB0E67_11305 [Streptomyces sp. NPDC032161]|uniref:hypothetical protein n=1 Tax=unclassified Streptomyces TaxID=2593676 RepID=UPI0033E03C63